VPVIVPLLQRLLLPSAADTPARASGAGGAPGSPPVALFATQLRAESSMARFLEAAAAAGLRVQQIEAAPGVVFHHLVTEEDPGSVLLHRITAGRGPP
jgi:hypothetical protein